MECCFDRSRESLRLPFGVDWWGTEKIEAIQLYSGTYWKDMHVEAESFLQMSELRMLRLGSCVHLKGEFQHFPKKLRWLEWCIEGYWDSLPDGLHLENIVVLDLSHSSITQLWNPQGLKSTKVFRKMKVLKLTDCWNLTICPDFTSMPHLQKLDLSHCSKMSELHPSILQLTTLEVLDLGYCSTITTLPSQMEPVLLGKLKFLNFRNCSNFTICPDFTSMPHLQNLNFSGCEKMSELHPSIWHLKSLTHLSLMQCSSITKLPPEIWQLTSLEELDLKCCSEITTLPSQMEDPKSLKPVLLGKLKGLYFLGCSNLTICPDFTSMPHLEKLNFASCGKISELHPSIWHLKSLTHLDLSRCVSLKQLPKEVWQLTSLEQLNLSNCSKITTLPSPMEDRNSLKPVLLSKLKVLNFRCSDLTICPDFTSMPFIEKLDFGGCRKMSELHPSIGLLKSLTHLDLSFCESLKQLPKEVWQLTSLEELDLQFCSEITTLPSQLGNCKSLARLSLWGCKSLMEVAEAVCHLTSLKELILSHCEQLEIIPDVSSLKGLQKLDLSNCRRLVNVLGTQEANFQNLGDFSIPGRRLLSHPQSLSFLLPKQFTHGIMYLHVDKSSLDNICSELDEWEDESVKSEEYGKMDSNDAERDEWEDESLKSEEDRSIPSDEVIDGRPGRAVLLEITTGDAKFQFSSLLKIKWHPIGEHYEPGYQPWKLPTATFGSDSELMRMAKQGEFNGNGDAQQRTMVTMGVSIDGCDLLYGDLFTHTEDGSEWLTPDPIEADDNFVIVEFYWPC